MSPHDPKDIPCDWCGERSVVAVEMKKKIKRGWVGVGQYIYACGRCKQKAESMQYVGK